MVLDTARHAEKPSGRFGQVALDKQCRPILVSQLQSLWRDKHPAIKGLRPPEHHAGKFRQDQKTPPSQKKILGISSRFFVFLLLPWLGFQTSEWKPGPRFGHINNDNRYNQYHDKHV